MAALKEKMPCMQAATTKSLHRIGPNMTRCFKHESDKMKPI